MRERYNYEKCLTDDEDLTIYVEVKDKEIIVGLKKDDKES